MANSMDRTYTYVSMLASCVFVIVSSVFVPIEATKAAKTLSIIPKDDLYMTAVPQVYPISAKLFIKSMGCIITAVNMKMGP